MKNKFNKSNKNEKKVNSSARARAQMESRLYRNRNQQHTKLTREDYLYSFPTCDLGSKDATYLDEIVVYYSFN